MSFKYMLDKQGNPRECEDLMEWATWFQECREQRRVARTEVGELVVSTVFLGINHRLWDDDGPPILWETMVFRRLTLLNDAVGDDVEAMCDRCAGNREQAEAMHARMVEEVKRKFADEHE